MHMITFFHMVNADADDLSNCFELIKRMFFVLYSKQQNVFLPHLAEVLHNPSLSLSSPPFHVGTIYPVAFVWTSFQFSVNFSLSGSMKKHIIFEFFSTYRTQQRLYRNFMNFLLIAKCRSKGLPCLFGHLFIYLEFFMQRNFSLVILIKIVLGSVFLFVKYNNSNGAHFCARCRCYWNGVTLNHDQRPHSKII